MDTEEESASVATSKRGPSLVRVAFARGDFRRLIGAMTISQAGDWLYNVGLLVYIFNRTHSAIWVAAGTIVRLLPYVFFEPIGGALADRYDRRKVMVTSDLVRALCMVVLALVATTSITPAVALALAFLASTAGAPYRPAVAATTPSAVPESDLAAANAAIEAIANVTTVVGPAIGGLLLAVGPPSVGFGVNALSFLAAGGLVSRLSLRQEPHDAKTDAAGIFAQVAEGVRALRSSGTAVIVIAFKLAVDFVYGEQTVLLVLASQQKLGTGSEGYAYLLAALGLGGVLAVGFTSRLAARPRVGTPMAIGLVVGTAPMGLLAIVRQPLVAFALLTVMGGATIIIDVVSPTWLQRVLPREVLGRVFGVYGSLSIGAMLAGALFAPLLVGVLGLNWALVVSGIGIPTLPLLGLPATRSIREVAAKRMEELSPWVVLLEGMDIFQGASRQSLELLAGSATKLTIRQGETVITQGEPAEHLFVIISGSFDVLFAREREAATVVNQLYQGDYFGEIGLLAHIPRTATVVAATSGQLLEINGQDFLAAINAAPAISGTLIRGMSGRLARTHPDYNPESRAAAANSIGE
jgi:MFS family permease